MALHPPSTRRERILTYGMSGAGKSTSWINVAEWIHKTRSEAKVFVLDTDAGWEAYRPLDGHLDSIVTVFDLDDWDSYMPSIKKAVSLCNPSRGDWLVLDMADKPWSKAQEGYFETISGKDFGSFFMESVRSGSGIGGDWGINWQAINKLYADFIDPVHRWKGHLLACAPAKQLQDAPRSGKDTVAPEIRLAFGRYGYVPDGQKNLPHIFHTVLLMQESPKGWKYTSVKDRARPLQRGVDLGSGENVEPGFVVKYLIGVAGWKP